MRCEPTTDDENQNQSKSVKLSHFLPDYRSFCLARVIVDTTVQPKAVAFPTDAKLLNRARERLVKLAQRTGVELRQSYARVGKLALIK